MKSRLKGLLALTLSLVMVFALATNAWAMVNIGGASMGDGTTTTYYYNGADGATGSTSDTDTGNWNAKVENVNGVQTLTLNGLDISTTAENGISATNNLTIVLNGSNSVEATWSGGGHAVVVDSGSLTIEGDGTLTATSAGDGHYALYASGNGGLYINGGEVTAESTDTAVVAGFVTITGDDTKLTATGHDKGISATYGDFKISGGEVTASGVDTAIAAKDLTITDGKVTATSYDYIGIDANTVTVSDGEVNATGTIAGIVVNSISISGGEVTAKATEDNSSGIDSGTDVSITGGTVTANAADNGGVGINCGDTITISGADTTVDAGCATGLKASTVNILDDSTVNIDADTTAIDSTTLNMGGNWYQWKDDNGQWLASSSGDAYKLTIAKAANTAKLYIKPATSTGGGGGGGYAPPIYYPTITVDSPKTFDAGIGIYVAMTILTATGGAWLAKKKD